ncbi:MAG: D-alanyl-D-alanine carboxypeptidase/D-alanyl-D-alanine-endopeptidase [Pyrinomonadaceae bacterium]|nr:D-alanyl-D-alanine carboxypeptidase/D-alanyl-D-alanine-endopeptidase [Pyrinomonadaceae bacterium]
MINFRNRTLQTLSLLLLFALLPGAGVSAQQGQQQRDRRVVVPATPSATPTPTPTPTVPASTPPATSVATRSVEELRARITGVLAQPQLASALAGIKIASLDTGRTVFEENANKFMLPASNMKTYTVAAALARLTPDYRFTTSVYAAARPDATGAVRGNLIVYGRGDPTFAARFNDESYFRAIDDLAGRIATAGVRRVEGDLIGDESYFTGASLGTGWEWDDLQWYYGAEVSALSVNDNAIDLTVKAGARAGDACIVTTSPAASFITVTNSAAGSGQSFVKIVNNATTVARGVARNLRVYRPPSQNVIYVSGTLPQDDAGFTGGVAVSQPAMMFVSMLRAALERRGVTVAGRTTTVNAEMRTASSLPPLASLVEIANRQSPPLSIVAAQTMKASQNLYTELILRALGQNVYPNGQGTSAEAGIKVVTDFLREAGIDSTKVIQADGSGLSRGNLITADATVRLLTYMSRHAHANVFRDTMPIAGVDGTLRARMKGTPAAGNVRAKTGTLSGVTSLSGYVTSASGERLVFALLVNNFPRDWDARVNYTDRIAVLLASFAGKS